MLEAFKRFRVICVACGQAGSMRAAEPTAREADAAGTEEASQLQAESWSQAPGDEAMRVDSTSQGPGEEAMRAESSLKAPADEAAQAASSSEAHGDEATQAASSSQAHGDEATAPWHWL